MCDTSFLRQAVPAYFHPSDRRADWARLAVAASVDLVVANVSNGPGLVREEPWSLALHGVRTAGSDVVGYVDTGYLGLTGLRTKHGSNLMDDWLEQILRDVTGWYELYGDLMTGIFFDQVTESNDGASTAPVFRRLGDHVRRQQPDAITVLNPGIAVPSAFADIADILVTFEGSCDAYLADGAEAGFEPLSWRPGPDQTIWHIVHHTPDAARAAEVVARSRRRGAELLYVTSGCGENPYSSLPSDEIWATAASNVPRRVRTRAPRPHCQQTGESHSWPAPTIPTGILAETTLIANPTLVRTLHAVEASADFIVSSACHRVFLASRRRGVPRWWTGSSPQIAADWLIENNRLYAYTGSGTDWTWIPRGEVTFEALGTKARWSLDADRVGVESDADADATFHVSAPGHREYSEVVVGHRGRA